MTWYLEDHGDAKPGKARQRTKNLTTDAREVESLGGDTGYMLVRWPMSGWQVWRVMDKEWSEWVCDAADKQDAMQLAAQEAAERARKL